MEPYLFKQEDMFKRLVRAYTNYKKTPKDRVIPSYIESRLENLEKLSRNFENGHLQLMLLVNKEDRNSIEYFSKDVYRKFEEAYIEYKSKMKEDEKKLSEPLPAGKSDSDSAATAPQARPMDVASDGSVSPITDPEDELIVVKMEPEDGQRIVMVQDPQTQVSVEGSFKKLHSHAPGDPLQPSTSNEPVIKDEIEIDIEDGDYKAMFLKLQQEVEILKADNESLTIENHNLAREIYNLKQTNPNIANAAALADALKDIQSINKDNELLRELAKENQRLSERICEYADKMQNLTSKYKHDESIRDKNVSVGFEKQDLNDKLRSLTDEYKNIVSERDNLKGQVKNLLEANQDLKINVKLQRKRVEMLRIQCVDNSEKMKRLKNSCFKLRSMYSKLKMARQIFTV